MNNFKCPDCKGTGTAKVSKDGTVLEECETCDGTGYWAETEEKFYGRYDFSG